ncbi:MAG: hypothetical protein R3B13_23030 [Polyangiaceae bacterium]
MTSTGQIRPVEAGDLVELIRLKREQGDVNGSWAARFDWQFARNPFREDGRPIGWVLDAGGGRLGGHQMAMPHRFQVLGTEQYVGISMDTFAHSDYRGAGIGRRLFEAYFEAQAGGLAVATTANNISEHIWLKADAIYLGDLNIAYLYPFRSASLVGNLVAGRLRRLPAKRLLSSLAGMPLDVVAKLRQPRLGTGTRVERVSADDAVLDEIWTRYRDQYRITNVRDARYRRWRYIDCPEPQPSLHLVTDSLTGAQGWFALKTKERGKDYPIQVCDVVDIFGPVEDARFQRQVISAALIAARETGADCMEFAGGHPSWRQHLRGLGFLRRTLPSNGFLCKNMSEIAQAALMPADAWHLVRADGDAAL